MRPVKFARFHSSINVLGFGELGTTLPHGSKVMKNLELKELTSGAIQASAVCEAVGNPLCGKRVTFVIGAASVLMYILADEPAVPKPVDKKS